MTTPVRNVQGAKYVGRRNKKDEKEEEGSGIWIKLKFFLSCIALGSRARDSMRGKNNENGKILLSCSIYRFIVFHYF